MPVTSGAKVNVAQRIQRVMELSLRRYSLRRIAEIIRLESKQNYIEALQLEGYTDQQIELEIQLNGYPNHKYTFQTVSSDLKSEVKALRQVSLDDARLYREMELQHLDSIACVIYDAAMSGDYNAIDRLLKISDQRCKLLGLFNTIDLRLREIIESRLESEFNTFFEKVNKDPKIPEYVRERLLIIAGGSNEEEDDINYDSTY
jgi:ribosomal protein S8